MVRGEGDDIWYQRLWRQLTPETMEAIVEQSQRFLLPLFRFNQSSVLYKNCAIYPLTL